MITVRVDRQGLLEIVRKGLEEHLAVYRQALEGYHEAAAAEMRRRVRRLSVHGEPVEHYIEMRKPSSYAESYEQAIEMLALSVDETVELDPKNYDQLVRGKWSWSVDFEASTRIFLPKEKEG